MKPLVLELYCGSFGWSAGWLALGGRSIGVDIEHCVHHGPVPPGADLILQDVRTLHGAQFKDAALILASPPCTQFSYRGRYGRKLNLPAPVLGIELFWQCWRIQNEASHAAHRYIPLVVENVVWAQEFIGRAVKHWGSFYLWGDVPALLPYRLEREGAKGDNAGLRSSSAGSRSAARKQMTAELSRIPLPLSEHIAKVYWPLEREASA